MEFFNRNRNYQISIRNNAISETVNILIVLTFVVNAKDISG